MTATAPLGGRNAIVVGVELPHGRAAAVALAEAGANVAAVTVAEDTKAEFAANSTANEFWAIGRKGIALKSDGRESTVSEAVADATAALGPISIAVWNSPTPIDRAALSNLRSDPAIIVILPADDRAATLAAWTRSLADAGLRANAILALQAAVAGQPTPSPLTPHTPPASMTIAGAAVYLASDATAALEATILVATDS